MQIGFNTYISPTAKILNLAGESIKNFRIGDNSYIGDDVQIICDDFELGDYCKIHHHTNIHGKKVHIGHNAWIGQYTIIDGLGETTIGNNCGIGAHSQLWSHIKYGDTLIGCRFESYNPLIIENDVWFVGHCIVSPIHAKNKSMALVGSVITKNMEENHIYAGSPAKDMTEKIGTPFIDVSIEERFNRMNCFLNDFGIRDNLVIVKSEEEILDKAKTYFNVTSRKYTKRLTKEEIAFMKYLLPAKGKFVPYDSL